MYGGELDNDAPTGVFVERGGEGGDVNHVVDHVMADHDIDDGGP